MSNEECIDSCLNDSACVLLQYNSINDECFQWNTSLHLQFLLLQESGPESHYYVMFKVDLPNDTCPASLDNVNLYFFTDIYYISWIKTYFGWQAGYCRDGWRRLIRSTPTCIKAVPMLFGTSKPEAEAKCNSIGAKLIGVETENEVNWMWEQVKQNASGQKSLYWLDGERVGVERTVRSTSHQLSVICFLEIHIFEYYDI
uniref:Apple domain-containing protein n=1 Tax=Caenorhabditis tropicalis TaxID=1561998 RepID=A0A1I7TBP8_9PELO